MSTATYRWNAQQAATDYDAAGPVIHPCYHDAQDAVLASLPDTLGHVVDLGGGSGRLAERILDERPAASVAIVDPSRPFLQLAQQRLRRFRDRAGFHQRRAQEPWTQDLPTPGAIVSTSALHHLDSAEKNAAFAACRAALAPGGVFINGDEYRPPSDAAYFQLLEEWRDHMRSSLAAGQIPATFSEVIDQWEARNLDGFGGARVSGDDCHETVEEQIARLYGAGFCEVEVTWRDRLWAVVVARR